MKLNVPIAKPFFGEEEYKAVQEVLSSGWVVQGPKVREFERLFAEHHNCKYAIALNSATSALHLGLMAVGVKEGDEVILPAFTFPASANVIIHLKARPVFVDIDLKTFNIDPGEIEKKLTSKTKAIMPVHLFGMPAEMDPILEIAKNYNLKIVEDSACGISAEYKGRKVGTIGDCGAFSFHPRKQITTGEGGMLTTNNETIADLVVSLRNHGESVSDEQRHFSEKIIYPEFIHAGYNYRMTDIQGAIGVEQMKKLPFIISERKRIADKYNELLSELEEKEYISLPHSPPYIRHTYQSYVILLKDKVSISRDELSYRLKKAGIGTRKGTYHVPLTKYYRKTFGFKKGDFPNSELADERSLALPIYPGMRDEEIEYVVEKLREEIL